MHEAGIAPMPALRIPRPTEARPTTKEHFTAHVRHIAGFLIEHMRGDKAIDTLMATSDSEAIALASACRLFGRDPDSDIRIVGYDNQWQTSSDRQWEPCMPLATIDKQNPLIGARLVEVLMDRVEGRLAAAPVLRLIPPRLLILSSTLDKPSA